MRWRLIILELIIITGVIYFSITDKSNPNYNFQSFREIKEKLSPDKKILAEDLNRNSVKEEYRLENGVLKVIESGQIIWQTPINWWIDNFDLADSTNDGIEDINLSVWKIGDFGQSKPFWVKDNDQSIKNHFFVFGFREGKVKPIWQSSNLSSPNCDFLFKDVDNDSKQDLVVIEGQYRENFICDGHYLAVWKWNSWGFSNEWRSNLGDYTTINLAEIPSTFDR